MQMYIVVSIPNRDNQHDDNSTLFKLWTRTVYSFISVNTNPNEIRLRCNKQL